MRRLLAEEAASEHLGVSDPAVAVIGDGEPPLEATGHLPDARQAIGAIYRIPAIHSAKVIAFAEVLWYSMIPSARKSVLRNKPCPPSRV